eukprot:282741_1
MSTLIVALPLYRYQKDMGNKDYLYNVRPITKELKRIATKLGLPITIFNENDDIPSNYSQIINWMGNVKKTMSKYSNIIYCVYGHGYIHHFGQDDKLTAACYITGDRHLISLHEMFSKYSQKNWQQRNEIYMVWVMDMIYSSYTAQTFPQLLTQNLLSTSPINIHDYGKLLERTSFITVKKPIFYDDTYYDNYEPPHLMTYFIQAMEEQTNQNQISLQNVMNQTAHEHYNNCKVCPGFQRRNFMQLPIIQINHRNESIIENVTNTLSSGISWLTNTISRGIRGGYENNNIKYITEINNDRGFLLTAGYIHYRIYVTKHPDYQEIIINIINIFLIGNNTGNNTDNISPFIVINCSCGYGHLSEPKKLNKLPFYNPNKYLKCWMDCRSRLMSTSVVYYCKGIECNYVVCEECIRQNNRGYNVLKQYLLERKNKYSKHDFKQSEGNVVVELLTCGNRNWKWILVRLNDNSNLGEYDPMSNDDKRNQNKRIYLLKPLKKARKTQSSQRKWLCRSCLTEIKTKTNRKRALEKHRC